ncbi:PREDICTED: aldehyde dehydrogenase X, mitochondrial-like isoform X1 [Bactrocera latifrons]|uniref:Aldehyde dehydrogenase X, mitochondrial n=1 Tax=Bactrocera latifrons TaxID=174628 RepID=A0A0K8V756_BACLA|nr:PREDICTED: aldehyde dehydrogenase X, mitochondrial-like isoform X1 [Bactrocera latifrons]
MANPNEVPKYTQLFINNEFVDAVSGKKFPTINPATGKVIAQIAEGDKADVDLAVAAAKKAFHRNSAWRKLSPLERTALIEKLCSLMERDKYILASLETQDNGKPFTSAIGDVMFAIMALKYYAGWTDKFFGDTIPGGDFVVQTRKEPIGVAGQIIPWNYPLVMLAWKWAPALAVGCTIVMKPAEQTPLTALHMAALSKEAGFPAGVINVIPGYGPTAGAAISEHHDIQKVAFTGSAEIGRIIMQAAAKSNLKRVTLELGGKSPFVVFDDVDVDKAVQLTHDAIFPNQGQTCCAGTRTYVHEKIYDEFVKKSVALAKARKIGDPFEASTNHGPQIDEEMMNKILGYIEIGQKQGAKLQCGGKRVGNVGYFIEPTVFSDVTDKMRIAQEEIFGPVMSIFKFSDIEEIIDRANDVEYGLAAGILTNDINKATKFANNVDAGSVWINCYSAVLPQAPFGGYKQSGIGREMGRDGLNNYLETKTITTKIV